jgi:hypothetical protein
MSSEKVEVRVGDINVTELGRKGEIIEMFQGRVIVKCECGVPLWSHSWELRGGEVCRTNEKRHGICGVGSQGIKRKLNIVDSE